MNSAIIANIEHASECQYLSQILKETTFQYFLVVVCQDDLEREVREYFSDQSDNCIVYVRDESRLGFLELLPILRKLGKMGVNLICRVTTLDTEVELGALHQEVLINSVLGSNLDFSSIFDAFSKSKSLSIIAPFYFIRSSQFCAGSSKKLHDKLYQKVVGSPAPIDTMYIEGNMYWTKLDKLLSVVESIESIFREGELKVETQNYSDQELAESIELLLASLVIGGGGQEEVLFLFPEVSPSPIFFHYRDTYHFRAALSLYLRKYQLFSDENWSEMLESSNFLDSEHYLSQVQSNKHFAEIPHYLLIGECEGYELYDGGEPKWYYIYQEHLFRFGRSALIDCFSNQRSQEYYFPNDRMHLYVASKWGLFCSDWYLEEYEDVGLSGMSPEEHYTKYGCKLGRYLTKANKLASISRAKFGNVFDYLDSNAWEDFKVRNLISDVFDSGNYELLYSISSKWLSTSYQDQFFLSAKAFAEIGLGKWQDAKDTWNALHAESDSFGNKNVDFLKPFSKPLTLSSGFTVIKGADKPVCIDDHSICIYTVLFGEYDDLLPPVYLPGGIKLYCVTDRERNVYGWEDIVVPVESGESLLEARRFKILPHLLFSEFDYSLFVDANTLFTGDIELLISQYLLGRKFVMWRHPERNGISLEVMGILKGKKSDPSKTIEQLELYLNQEGLPRGTGLCESSFVWRSHRDKELTEFMEDWWSEVLNRTRRDQLGLCLLMWKKNLRPEILPEKLGDSRRNCFFLKLRHISSIPTKEPVDKMDDLEVSIRDRASLRFPKRNIAFLFHEDFRDTGTTVMRGQQLSKIVGDSFKGRIDVSYSRFPVYRNSILFLTKGFLKRSKPEELYGLKKQGNVLLFDFVDGKAKKDIVEFADVLVASSIGAYTLYKQVYPHIRSHLITHHVDPRLLALTPIKHDVFRAGYFGESLNTVSDDVLRELVTFFHVDTSSQNDNDWFTRVPDFNFHYAIRKTRYMDGSKPFLKGFVASYFNANILVQRSNTEALQYLGGDYPYIVDENLDAEGLAIEVARARDSFGGPDWERGLEIMGRVKERCSNEFVLNEFSRLIESL